MENDIRWVQRLDNYSKAMHRLEAAVNIIAAKMDFGEEIDDLLEEGLIQRFEYTHELAWNTMKDYETYQGYTDIKGSRDAIRKALETGLVDDSRWMDTIADRNRSSHNYDEIIAGGIAENIIHVYFPLFKKFEKKMMSIYESGNL